MTTGSGTPYDIGSILDQNKHPQVNGYEARKQFVKDQIKANFSKGIDTITQTLNNISYYHWTQVAVVAQKESVIKAVRKSSVSVEVVFSTAEEAKEFEQKALNNTTTITTVGVVRAGVLFIGFNTKEDADKFMQTKTINESLVTSPFEKAGLTVKLNPEGTKAFITIYNEDEMEKFSRIVDDYSDKEGFGEIKFGEPKQEGELFIVEVDLPQFPENKATDPMKELKIESSSVADQVAEELSDAIEGYTDVYETIMHEDGYGFKLIDNDSGSEFQVTVTQIK
jgi:hypothetical protein